MRYEDSLTASIQTYISQTLSQKIAEANSSLATYNTVTEIRNYLSDESTMNTPSFVLRRYIQMHHSQLVSQFEDLPDLTKKESYNMPWPEHITKEVSKKLSKVSLDKHSLKLSSATWTGYLAGAGARQRQSIFKLAFVLQMSVEDTMDLLMAFDMESYSARCPLDLICLFCQQEPGSYSWKDVEEMLSAFEKGSTNQVRKEAEPSEGMTQVIISDLQAIFARNLPQAKAKAALVDYMLQHAGEFKTFFNNGEFVCLPGYSLGKMKKHLRFAKYLSVLYQKYTTNVSQDTRAGEHSYEDVDALSDGYPCLNSLTKAMFQSQNWNTYTVSKKSADYCPDDYIFNNYINRYLEHAMAIDRLRNGANNAAFFERTDALMHAFFFINGYLRHIQYPDDHSVAIMDTLNSMIAEGDEFDQAIGDALSILDDLDDDLRYECIKRCINIILTQLEYSALYVPSPFDRFVLLSLLSEDPDGISPLVLHAAYLEEYETT